MALSSTVYRFKIQLSDIERGIYESFDLRVARHPSEAVPFLLTRVIAYCLNLQEGIAMTAGIGSPDEPALWVKDLTGAISVWIEIGVPSARRLHKASKTAGLVRVYTHRDPEILLREMDTEEIHRRDEIEIFSITPDFLEKLGTNLARDNSWELLHDEGELSISSGSVSVQGTLREL